MLCAAGKGLCTRLLQQLHVMYHLKRDIKLTALLFNEVKFTKTTSKKKIKKEKKPPITSH